MAREIALLALAGVMLAPISLALGEDDTVGLGSSDRANYPAPGKLWDSFSYWTITKIPSLAGSDLTTFGPFLLEPRVLSKSFSKGVASRHEPMRTRHFPCDPPVTLLPCSQP
jgi:hypothetical protein